MTHSPLPGRLRSLLRVGGGLRGPREPPTDRGEPAFVAAEDRGRRRPRPLRDGWLLGAGLVLVLGLSGSVIGATLMARSAASHSRAALRTSSAQIASALQLALQHEQDLVVSAKAFFVSTPNAPAARFSQWASVVSVMERYPELNTVGNAVIVPAAGLGAFKRRIGASGRAPALRFAVTPPGTRPFYCFVADSVTRASLHAPPSIPGLDFCATPAQAAVGLGARDSGQAAYVPELSGKQELLVVFTPVYRDGASPATIAARRGEFLGWVWTVVTPRTLLDRALQGHPRTAVTFDYHGGVSGVSFSSGTVPHGAQTSSVDLHNGWSVGVSGLVTASSVFAVADALALLIAGAIASILLGALVFVLATGRARATRLVALRTDELRHQALHDALTGLPNRVLITDRVSQLLARSRRAGVSGAALYFDLDEFKNVNDTLGHEAGDRLLQAVAERLKTALRDADTIGRMGGDEFVVLLDGGGAAVGPELVAERLLAVMRQPFEIEGASMPLTVYASIGIAVGDRETAGDLLRDADVALYAAKEQGKNSYQLFDPRMETEVQERVGLEYELRRALADGQFRLVYQPIYALDDLEIVGAEALLRWDHPTRGTVMPDAFIPLLEASGQIVEVGAWVMGEACRQMARWHAIGSALGVSVNVSARELDRDGLVTQIREALEASGLDPAALTIEVTETALMRDTGKTARRLHAIKAIGVQIAVDDFGTGYSSLAYLQQFPVDSLKIDRAFTSALARSPASEALIHTLVQLGRDLGLRTLAEGVETAEQIDHLRGEHVNEAQGFLLARPLDAATLERKLLRPVRGTPAGRRGAGAA